MAVDASIDAETSSQKSCKKGPKERSNSPSAATDITVSINKEDLWKDAAMVELSGSPGVTVQWFEIKKHVVFGRAVGADEPASAKNVTVGQVLDVVVDEMWKRTAKSILQEGIHVRPDSYPPAPTLLSLGSVWLLNEKQYVAGHGSHAHRLHPEDETSTPDWKEFTLRIYTCPDRFFAADALDWSKYCRGLLLNSEIAVSIDGEKPHVPVTALPDEKDGAIVYENDDLGFAVLNKPGSVPIHPNVGNHNEDVISKFTMALRDSKKHMHVTLPNHYPEIDTETYGLVAVATKAQFSNYMSKLLQQAETAEKPKLTKIYKCLVCVRDPERMGLLEAFQKTAKLITHYSDPVHHHFVRSLPNNNNTTHWQKCQLRVLKVGDDKFRAACVSTKYQDSVDSSLAHRLWGPHAKEGVEYVMELEVETVGKFHAHQVRGQLAALGFPIVGDAVKGGGSISVFSERHEWKRMALQCCELSFPTPVACAQKKKPLQEGDGRCVFRLDVAWWSEYLRQYELYHIRV